jgi:hypothetical protein
MQNRVRISFDEGASAGLPPLDVAIPSDADVEAEIALRRAAPIAADLMVRRLLDRGYLSVTQLDSTREKLEKAYARPRTVTVEGPGGKPLELSELERMIRDLQGAWPQPDRPATDPDAWMGAPSASEIAEIRGLLDAWRYEGKLKDGIDERDAVERYFKTRRRMQHGGLYLAPADYAAQANLLRG